jgi:release factor glutamine methyltransferase
VSGVVSLRALWSQTAEVVGSRVEARWLCEVAVALDGAAFEAALDEPVTDRMVAHLDAMVARARTGEPLQYVLGRWGFRRLDLAVDRRVLIPRPETELVAETAIALAAGKADERVVADLGTGSGAIGLSLAAELPLLGTTVWITDISDDALAVARANLAGIGRAARNVRVATGSWFDALPGDVRFDVIVSNPPYVADESPLLEDDVRDWEPPGALFAGGDGLDAIRLLVGGAPGHLAPGGWLVLEHSADQADAVRSLFEAAGYERIDTRQDLAGLDRFTVGQWSSTIGQYVAPEVPSSLSSPRAASSSDW